MKKFVPGLLSGLTLEGLTHMEWTRNAILVGKGQQQCSLDGAYGNRHELVASANAPGGAIMLMMLAEGFSRR